MLCSSCLRSFHNVCLGDANLHHIHDSDWKCPACLTLPPPHGDDQLLRVQWQPTWEAKDTLSCTMEGQALIDQWVQDNHDQPPTRMDTTALDSHLPNIVRQGGNEHSPPPWLTTMGDPIRGRIHFEFDACNPQLDIQPTGECKIEIRQIERWAPPSMESICQKRQTRSSLDDTRPPHPHITHNTITQACFYRADGRCMGTRTPERLTILRQLYDRAAASGMHSQISPPIRSFEEEAVDCILRHTKQKKDQTPAEEWHIPPPLYSLIHDTLHTTKLRSANPWTVPDSTTPYWSSHPRDRVFGAEGNPYDTRWTGYSQVLATSPDEGDSHTRWAVYSAQTAQPDVAVATAIYIPRALRAPRQQAYHRWINSHPDYIMHIGSTTGSAFPFQLEDGWNRNTGQLNAPRHKAIDIILVCNKLGK